MIDLPIELNHLLHLGRLGLLPQSLGDERRRLGHDQHARLDLEDVAVPQAALVLGQGLVEVGLDHVLDADQTGAGRGAVVQQALADVLGEVAAVVVGLDNAGRVRGVDVEGVEVGADVLEGGEVLGQSVSRMCIRYPNTETCLCHGGARLKDGALGAARLAGHLGLGLLVLGVHGRMHASGYLMDKVPLGY